MVTVTDKKINMHPALKGKLDLMIHRMDERGFDNFLIVDGKEGFGKTTFATQVCYYVSQESKRSFSVDNIYFRVEQMLEDMKKERAKIFLLDEAELDLLSETRGKMQRYFIQMLMAARKKNHFIVAIIPAVKKLKSYVIERAIGLVRVYSPDGIKRGFYAYYKEESKNAMYENWMRSRKMDYKKYYTFNGTFNKEFSSIIDEDLYDKKKDEAIASIGEEEKESQTTKKWNIMRYKIYRAIIDKKINVTIKDMSKAIGITGATMSDWRFLIDKHPYIKETLE